MIQVDTGEGFRAVDASEIVGWENGDEFYSLKRMDWQPSTFSIKEKHPAGISTPYRRPLSLSIWFRIKMLWRKAFGG